MVISACLRGDAGTKYDMAFVSSLSPEPAPDRAAGHGSSSWRIDMFKIRCLANRAVPLLLLAAVLAAAARSPAAAGDKNSDSAARVRQLIAVIERDASPPQNAFAVKQAKAAACKQLAIYGDASAVGPLAKLLDDAELASWARIALEAIPGRAAAAALREARGRLHGKLLVGVINSIGVRRDAEAVAGLAESLRSADAEVLEAAAVALGHIGTTFGP